MIQVWNCFWFLIEMLKFYWLHWMIDIWPINGILVVFCRVFWWYSVGYLMVISQGISIVILQGILMVILQGILILMVILQGILMVILQGNLTVILQGILWHLECQWTVCSSWPSGLVSSGRRQRKSPRYLCHRVSIFNVSRYFDSFVILVSSLW